MDQQELNSLPRRLNGDEVNKLISRCQYLHNIEIFKSSGQYLSLIQNFKKIQIRELQELVVQFFYLCFICLQKNINPQINEDFIVYGEQYKKPLLLINDFLQNQNEYSYTQGTYFNFFQKILVRVIEMVQEGIANFQTEEEMNQANTLSEINLLLMDSVNMPSESQLVGLHQDWKKVKEQFPNDIQCFCQLEKSSFIRSISVLHNMNNCSITLVLYKNPPLKNILIKSLEEEAILIQKFKTVKIIKKKCFEELLQIEKRIQNNMRKCFQTLNKNPFFIKNQICQKNKIKITLKLNPQIQYPFWDNKKQAEQPLCYTIQYFSQKQLVIVRLFTTVSLEWVKADNALFQWNYLCFNGGNYSLEMKTVHENDKTKKFLVVKGISEIRSSTKSLIRRIIKLIEGTTALKCVVMKQMKQAVSESDLQPHRQKGMSKMINHYINLGDQFSSNLLNQLMSK